MANPPALYFNKEGGETISYFESLIEVVRPIFESEGIALNFQGYNELIKDLNSLESEEFDKSWRLARETNAWSEYISDLLGNAKRVLKNAESEKIATLAKASNDADKDKVSNGDRLASKDDRVIAIRIKRNNLEAFVWTLTAKIDFLNRSHYFCKTTCGWTKKLDMLRG